MIVFVPQTRAKFTQFAHLSVDRNAANLGHSVPRGADIFAFQLTTSHPFPTLWSAKDETAGLVELLPSGEDLHFYLGSFQRRVQSCSFPHVPEECTEAEIRGFLENVEHNAAVHPNMLALLFAALAQGLQDGVYDRNGEKWIAGSVEAESQKGDVYIAAGMQALRLAAFLNRPTLLTIQTLIMMGAYLTNCGKFLDASAMFGVTVRLAQSIGLHRDPSELNPPPSPREIITRKNLWWWMLHMDQHYSMALGRPLAISSIGDCPAPDSMSPDPYVQSLSNYISQFTMLGRQILSVGYLSNDQIDRFSDELLLLKQTLPGAVNFDETWLNKDKNVPGWPLNTQAAMLHAKTHNFLILLNRQRLENNRRDSTAESVTSLSNPASASDPNQIARGRDRVLESCRALLAAFEFFHTRLRAAMICWIMGQMAFNAAMILTLSMLETNETRDLGAVQHTYSTFIEMNKLGIHKLAGDAVERLGPLLKGLVSGDSIKEKVMGQQGMMLLEDNGSQGFEQDDFSSLSVQMAGGGLRYDDRRRSAGRARMGFPMSSSSKSALAQRRRAHRTLSMRDVRPRIPARKLSLRNPRSPIHRPPSGRLSPKRPKQEQHVMETAGDMTVLPSEPTSSFSYISPTQQDHDSQTLFLSTENAYQPFQATDFDPPTASPLQINFDPHSQPNNLPQHPQPLPYPPQNTPIDADPQSISYPTHLHLEGANFLHHNTPQHQHQQQQQQQQHQPFLEHNNLESHSYMQQLQYETPQFDMTQIPVSYPPPY